MMARVIEEPSENKTRDDALEEHARVAHPHAVDVNGHIVALGATLDLTFPIEFLVSGTPVSFQSARAQSKFRWKEIVKAASRSALPEGHFAHEGRLAATLFYFPAGQIQGDVDNIVKLVLDALTHHIYLDDAQIERVVVQKFEPDRIFPFANASSILAAALEAPKPLLYVRLSDDPFEELT